MKIVFEIFMFLLLFIPPMLYISYVPEKVLNNTQLSMFFEIGFMFLVFAWGMITNAILNWWTKKNTK